MSHNNLQLVIDGTLLVNNDRDSWPKGKDIITATGVNNIGITGSGTVETAEWLHFNEALFSGPPEQYRPGLEQLRDTLQSALGQELPSTLVFDYPNLAAIAGFIASDVLPAAIAAANKASRLSRGLL